MEQKQLDTKKQQTFPELILFITYLRFDFSNRKALTAMEGEVSLFTTVLRSSVILIQLLLPNYYFAVVVEAERALSI